MSPATPILSAQSCVYKNFGVQNKHCSQWVLCLKAFSLALGQLSAPFLSGIHSSVRRLN